MIHHPLNEGIDSSYSSRPAQEPCVCFGLLFLRSDFSAPHMRTTFSTAAQELACRHAPTKHDTKQKRFEIALFTPYEPGTAAVRSFLDYQVIEKLQV